MSSTKKRVLRLVTAVGLTGAILAGPAGIGGAQAAQAGSFAGTSTGYALRVTLDLRPLINNPLIGSLVGPVIEDVVGGVVESITGEPFTGVIDQYIIKTTSDADSNGVTKARSVLAEGLINLDSLEATAIGQVLESTFTVLEGLPLVSGSLGTLKAAVLEGPAVAGNGVLHELNLGLGDLDLGSLLGVGDLLDLTNLLELDDLGATLDGVVGQLDDLLGGLLGGLLGEDVLGDLLGDGVTQGLLDTVGGLTGGLGGGSLLGGVGLSASDSDADDVLAVVTGLLDDLVGTITGLLETSLLDLDGLLASINGLVNNTGAVQLASGQAVAQSVASLESINVLGGLIDVGLFNLGSRSEAAGTAGSAKNTSHCSIADVKIGDDAFSLSLDGSSISIGGTEVPLVGDLVGQVKGVVDGLLGALGINIGLCETAKVEADPQGLSASQSVSALSLRLAPLGLFSLVIDPTVQTAVDVQPQAAAPPAAAPPSGDVTLPTTGAAHVATALSGLALVGAALLVRRRLV